MSVTTIDSEKILKFAQNELDRQAETLVKETIQAYMSKELVGTIKSITRDAIASRAIPIKAKVDKYLDENLDRLCETSAKQMLEEALGEVKRRVLGRTSR